jgi:hypothetical protein
MANTRTTYGKLSKPELGGGLTIQTGQLDFATVVSAILSAKLTTPIKNIQYLGVSPAASAGAAGKVGGVYLATHAVGSAAQAVIVRRLSAIFRYYNYVIIGY